MGLEMGLEIGDIHSIIWFPDTPASRPAPSSTNRRCTPECWPASGSCAATTRSSQWAAQMLPWWCGTLSRNSWNGHRGTAPPPSTRRATRTTGTAAPPGSPRRSSTAIRWTTSENRETSDWAVTCLLDSDEQQLASVPFLVLLDERNIDIR